MRYELTDFESASIRPFLPNKARGISRNLIERSSTRSSNVGAVATRYDKLAANYPAFIKLASIRIWLRANESTPQPSAATWARFAPVSSIWSPIGGKNRQANPSRIPAVHVAAAAARNPMSDWVVTNWQPRLMRST